MSSVRARSPADVSGRADVSVSVPDASVDVSKPSRDVDTIAEMLSFGGKVEAPTPVVSVDVSAPSADRSGLKGPDKPAVEVPSVDDNVDVSTPDVSVNVSTASVDVGGKMPDVFGGVPDVSAEVPKVDDVGMSAPDVSMSAPGVGVSDDSAKVKDVKVELPDAPSAEGKTPKKGLRRIIDLAKRKLEVSTHQTRGSSGYDSPSVLRSFDEEVHMRRASQARVLLRGTYLRCKTVARVFRGSTRSS